ncbi:amino acid/amide ABC transporter ATP-binding protein 2 (HAAT family) [Roseiarcus fermentans]|uniref:Amino acid/amide ABC transporter ATP-binding protein 2 (HAAT family) n=1 Tax=Roseiarcus fermentans TaxID=1473586 RepID=A0A366F7L1_9HYPH|nr:urea ABC transporter ATP-binding subunit UrtE [Roseiarcus fermentans]RBP10634.1 amino acid/amide ABC transporter ATP-binding protein 2 (HAAT family) [Roseiarcus fermentans]
MLTVDRIDLFYGAAQALRSVSIKAETGRILTVLGRNGVGKSSLLRAIVGQHMVASGAIRWNDHDVTRLPSHLRARSGFGYVPQGREIFPLLTVRENLMTGFAALKRAERVIDDEIFSLFPVLNDMLGRRGGDLSGGQQQQLAIARALVTKPKLLILDEPTEGIQPSIIKDIGRALVHLRRRGDMAILVVEQYFEWARDICDDYAVMDRGAVVLAGTREAMNEADVRGRMTV